MLRNGQCPYFYVLFKDFSVLFIASGVCGTDTNVRAIISHSSSLLKQQLEMEKVKYEIDDQGPLIFVGRTKVHALYDFIMNSIVFNGTAIGSLVNNDVPKIISPVAFVHATLKSSQV